MQRFKNITLVHECDAATLRMAVQLAKENSARLTVVHVIPEMPDEMKHVWDGSQSLDVRNLVLRDQQEKLTKVAEKIKKSGVRAATRLLVGDPSLEIVRDVVDKKRDLVIMTAEGDGGVKSRLFGSTSSRLLRKCPVPLLVVKPGRSKRLRRVLAAVDPEASGSERDTLNGTILNLATAVCARSDAQLHVIHAWSLFGEESLRWHGGLTSREIGRWNRKEAERRRVLVEELLARHQITGAELHLVKGDASDAIVRYAATHRVDLLVMGTVCRTGIPGFIIGNTAERVLSSINCSVLTVKPVGFVTPVAPMLAKHKGRRDSA